MCTKLFLQPFNRSWLQKMVNALSLIKARSSWAIKTFFDVKSRGQLPEVAIGVTV